ncbi:MAG: hypothetical protein KGH50_01710, partial [Candidatus Micrarchaeota archaeon]|nr:hypothetical protein [Candidatus Micrarchaeota archaeon]
NTTIISSIATGLNTGGLNYKGVGNYYTYTLHIPRNIKGGSYTLHLMASYTAVPSASSGTSSAVTGTSDVPITIFISGTPNIALTASPSPQIVPGQQSDVKISATNAGTDNATNVSIKVLNSRNFSVAGSSMLNLGTIAQEASGSGTVTLQANTSLASGNSSIPMLLTYSTLAGANYSKVVMVPVSVLINRPNIVASIIDATPSVLRSGANQTLTVGIQNIGTGVAKNLTVSFMSTSNITVGNAASGIFIATLQPNQTATYGISITASSNANYTSYSIPIRMGYQTANYQQSISKNTSINVTLQKAAIFNVTGVSGYLNVGGTYVPLTFTVRNVGNEPANHVTVSLQTIYPISSANSNAYVESLAPGQSRQVTFYVNVDSQGNPGPYPVTLYEQWTQPNGATNQQYTGSNNYYANVGGTGNGPMSKLPISDIVLGIIIVVAAALLLRRFRPEIFARSGKNGKAEKPKK